MAVKANFEVHEGTLVGAETIEFNFSSVSIELTNDSATVSLSFKFAESGAYATLKPNESRTTHVTANRILLLAPSTVPYRLWITS